MSINGLYWLWWENKHTADDPRWESDPPTYRGKLPVKQTNTNRRRRLQLRWTINSTNWVAVLCHFLRFMCWLDLWLRLNRLILESLWFPQCINSSSMHWALVSAANQPMLFYVTQGTINHIAAALVYSDWPTPPSIHLHSLPQQSITASSMRQPTVYRRVSYVIKASADRLSYIHNVHIWTAITQSVATTAHLLHCPCID